MAEKASISVVIPLYNKEASIERTIQTVLTQGFVYFELIVVNDGSTDNGLEIVKSIKDKRIKIINKENGGVSSARNRGILEATADYIAFLDADDYWEPDYLEEMYKLIMDFPDASIYGCAYDWVENGMSKTDDFHFPLLYRNVVDSYFKTALNHHLFWTSAVIVRKRSIQEIGCFDERMSIGEDLDVWFRMNLNYQGVFFNKVLAHYNIDGPNRAMKRKLDYRKSIMFYFDKYKDAKAKNADFSVFINKFKAYKVFDLLKNYELSRKEIKVYISEINKKEITPKMRFLLSLPNFLIILLVTKIIKIN